ncbi:MAG: OmpA family protein [Crocinitomicaceae bacterium]|nr:OmpA family protein [Crocinitomicaceae bacterium]
MKFILIIALLFPLSLLSQDIKGTWKGILKQNPDKQFYFEIRVDEVDSKGNVKGITFIREESSNNFGTISYSGTFLNNVFKFQETEILKEDKNNSGYYASNNFYWCIKKGELKFSENEKKFRLNGAWESTGTCVPGTIDVWKDKKIEKVTPPVKDPPKQLECDLKSADFLLGLWKGEFYQHSCGVNHRSPIIIMIDRVDGLKFYGEFIWTAMKYASDSRSTLEGEIKNGKIYFYENELISGGGLVLHGEYENKLTACDKMDGFWYLPKPQGGCGDLKPYQSGGEYDLTHYLIPTIYFDHESSALRPKSITDLDEFSKFLIDFPSISVQLNAHTDNTGSNAFNMILSRERAQVVADYLTKKGISSKRIKFNYHAHTQPAESNKTEQGKELNRRTEIKIVSKKK